MTATFVTDLLGKLVSVYQVDWSRPKQGDRCNRHLVSGYVRAADLTAGKVVLVLEVIAAPAWDGEYRAGDLLSTATIYADGLTTVFSLTDHPPGVVFPLPPAPAGVSPLGGQIAVNLAVALEEAIQMIGTTRETVDSIARFHALVDATLGAVRP